MENEPSRTTEANNLPQEKGEIVMNVIQGFTFWQGSLSLLIAQCKTATQSIQENSLFFCIKVASEAGIKTCI